MSDIDLTEFFRLSRPKKKPCAVKFATDQLKPAERAQIEAACEADKSIITSGAIREWLARRNHDVSMAAVTTHRSRNCTCRDAS